MPIPFYEAVLKQRLPDQTGGQLKTLDPGQTWLGDTLTLDVFKESAFTGNKESLCLLPDSIAAARWKEYILTGNVTDRTPPPAPFDLQIKQLADSVELSWKADADIESGIKFFKIYRDGKQVGRLPETGTYQTFDTNGDNTIPVSPPDMKYRIAAQNSEKAIFSVSTVNNDGLESAEAQITWQALSHEVAGSQ
jgi:hypothetical protein